MSEIEKLNMIAEWQEQHKQLIEDLDNSKKQIAELKEELEKKADTNHSLVEQMADLESENAELKEVKKKKEEIEIMTNFCKACKKIHTDNLTKAKEIIKKLYAVYYDPCVTESDLKYRDELFAEIKQFLSEVEK